MRVVRFVVPSSAKTWIEAESFGDFPIQNLPFGVGIVEEEEAVLSRIGDFAINLSLLADEGFLPDIASLRSGVLELDPSEASHVRARLAELLEESSSKLRQSALRKEALIPIENVAMAAPTHIGAFVDFFSGIHHATNTGRLFRPDGAPLLPNYRSLPVAYNGRASSVCISGTPVTRPNVQTKAADAESPSFGPTKELDFELEIGFFLGRENEDDRPIRVEDAEDHILGFVLVNDWSARDTQRWEGQPLGPFLAKSFATSISPWVVTLDALQPFRVQGEPQIPEPLSYLKSPGAGHFDISLAVALKTPAMEKPEVITKTNADKLYWTAAQQLCHQTSNGTPVEVGDLYASGTISGPPEDAGEVGCFGSMLELTARGTKPLVLSNGETRSFLENGDEVVMTGVASRPDLTIGFGELHGTVKPALSL